MVTRSYTVAEVRNLRAQVLAEIMKEHGLDYESQTSPSHVEDRLRTYLECGLTADDFPDGHKPESTTP